MTSGCLSNAFASIAPPTRPATPAPAAAMPGLYLAAEAAAAAAAA
eukprot:CAMPEP_0115508818 /NCGR_PEP_ID=MMETSP0271-20121206/72510_1 /TAXON_ID=71861 /ORGANISM="Scrippsiella trochoidea, Strain CCMP3099" /LENGTH=44 /DNA_ID= /DNA_START= /DNA_END= /DNA_ORIENTATION=